MLLFSWFAAMVSILVLSSTVMASNTSMQVASTTPRFTYVDTWNNIHPMLMFDGYITDPTGVAPRYDVVSSAKWYNVSQYRSTNPNMFLTYYMPFHRDNGTFRSILATLPLNQWKATHPSWILYKCDRKTPAYEFGDAEVPLDFSNPDVLNFQMQTYGIPASQSGYDGITVDNLNMENLFGACGTYQNGKWVQRYSGKYNDGRWEQDAVNWIIAMQQALHNLPHPMAMILNLGYGPSLTPTSPLIQQVLTHSDGILDEAGFTHYGSAFLTDQYWLQAIQLSNIEQNAGKPFYIIDNFPVLNRANMQWALSTYLMAKGHYCNLFVSTTQNYGIDAWHSEYSAQIGSPTGAMFASQHVYWRNYTHGVTIVNPSSKSTFKVTLNASLSYVDLYGNSVGSTVVLPPHSGIVLLATTRGNLHIFHIG